MGKKAKIRKQRHQLQTTSSDIQQINPHNFIKQIEKTGYRQENIQRSPEIPREDVEPQV